MTGKIAPAPVVGEDEDDVRSGLNCVGAGHPQRQQKRCRYPCGAHFHDGIHPCLAYIRFDHGVSILFEGLGLDVEIGRLDSGVGFDSLFSFRIDGTALAYLKAGNQILRSKLSKRIELSNQERRRLVKHGKSLGARIKDLISIVSYSTFRKWVRSF